MVSIQSQCSYCLSFLHCALSLVVQCIVIGLHQSGSVGAGSDHLQLIKFWWSCAPGKGSAPGGGNFGSALLQPLWTLCVYGGLRRARSVCVSLSTFSFHSVITIMLICYYKG